MEYDKIKQLMEDMSNSNLSAIEIDFPDGTKVSMKKEVSNKVITTNNPEEKTESMDTTEVIEEKIRKGNIVKSPMVGTFYLKPSPTSDPYVEIGKTVRKNDTLCIIEAMKLMNEIESEYEGKITEIYVKDGEPVEYGTELFCIE